MKMLPCKATFVAPLPCSRVALPLLANWSLDVAVKVPVLVPMDGHDCLLRGF